MKNISLDETDALLKELAQRVVGERRPFVELLWADRYVAQAWLRARPPREGAFLISELLEAIRVSDATVNPTRWGNEVFGPVAPIWVCTGCRKTSRTREPSEKSDKGYDVSCMLNSVWARPASGEELKERPEVAWYMVERDGESE